MLGVNIIIELPDQKLIFVIVGFVAFVIVSYRAYKRLNIKCPYCGLKMKLVSVSDSAGVDVKTQVKVFIDFGPRRHTQIWLCDDCAHKKHIKVWG